VAQPIDACTRCQKTADLCICESIHPVETKFHVLILQHPQEPDKDLGSARIAHLSLPNSTLKVGLSWPNLAKALGRPADNQRWAVLYLGSGAKGRVLPGLTFVTKKSEVLNDQPSSKDLDGIILIDGTWSQAKTIWWRNAWLLKVRRAILAPQHKSLYRELRKEPRRECLSTIESIAEALTSLGEPQSTGDSLRKTFSDLLDKERARIKARKQKRAPIAPVAAPKVSET
jgi:DTW domain-containing protein YfiP